MMKDKDGSQRNNRRKIRWWEEDEKESNTWSLCVCGGLGWRTEGEEGRGGGKKGNERSRTHPLRATRPSHNPLLQAWKRLPIHRVTEGRLLAWSCNTHTHYNFQNKWKCRAPNHTLLTVACDTGRVKPANTQTEGSSNIHINNLPAFRSPSAPFASLCQPTLAPLPRGKRRKGKGGGRRTTRKGGTRCREEEQKWEGLRRTECHRLQTKKMRGSKKKMSRNRLGDTSNEAAAESTRNVLHTPLALSSTYTISAATDRRGETIRFLTLLPCCFISPRC